MLFLKESVEWMTQKFTYKESHLSPPSGITCRKSHWRIPPLTHSLSGTCKHRQVEWYELKKKKLFYNVISVFSSSIYTILVTKKMPFANSLHPTMFISNISQGDVSVNDRYHAWLLNLRLTLSLIKRLKLVHACFVCDEICKRKFLYAGQISSLLHYTCRERKHQYFLHQGMRQLFI